jgi:hypothetical protein
VSANNSFTVGADRRHDGAFTRAASIFSIWKIRHAWSGYDELRGSIDGGRAVPNFWTTERVLSETLQIKPSS